MNFKAGMREGGPARLSLRWSRLLVLLLASVAAGLLADALRQERVFFPRPLPAIETESP
jgi:hypothetical protein